jgi:putative membrane protein
MTFSTASSQERRTFKKDPFLWIFILVFTGIWLSTLIGTSDLNNWLLENTLVFLFIGGLVISYRNFKFSDLSYLLITVFLCAHVYGAKYTYAENPFGDWLKDTFDWERNHYDRLVHFAGGFLLAYPVRDYFMNHHGFSLRVSFVLPVFIMLSIGGMYELIEWAVADVFFPEQGQDYLGTQGDEWDGQKDMALAFGGAVLMMLITATVRKIFRK